MRSSNRVTLLASTTLILLLALAWWGIERRQVGDADDIESDIAKLACELPTSWSLDDIGKSTPPYGHDAKGVYVLAWTSSDEAGDSCLAMRVLDNDDGFGRWCLAHLCRSSASDEWRLSTMHVLGARGSSDFPGRWIHHATRFKTQPTNKDIYAALDDDVNGVGWSHLMNDGNPALSKFGVCEANWKHVTGQSPTELLNR